MDLTGHLLYYQEGRHRINLNDYVQHNQLNKAMDTMNNSISEALKSKVDSITKITYSDLKNLRDNSQLTPGSLYRITNYNNTTDVTFDGLTSHQFDIILLALTPNTLAEEGWAAMHDNIYDVTFSDEVTKKCYINILNDNLAYIIDINTLIGTEVYTVNIDDYSELKTNEENKTAIVSIPSELLLMENLPYNYFQNRNLSTWKVWYSLDNDTARFSWADNSVDLSTEEQIGILRPAGASGPSSPEQHYIARRDIELDVVVSNTNYYCWTTNYNMHYYTISENPTIGDTVYNYISSGQGEVYNSGNTVESYTPTHEGTGPIGRGVIYRITDESGELCKLQWQELKTIRDSKALVADTKYRIVDYQCTTTQENTRSAGHQFDIVLLALSNDKLAEEGWAMEHPTDVYDVTFTDGVTLKGYLYTDDGENYSISSIETHIGSGGLIEGEGNDFILNEVEKTIIFNEDSGIGSITFLEGDVMPYNYFQNSNLSAWKVWYCLDNDTDRFAWAQNEELLYGVDSSLSNGKPLKRCPTLDNSHESARLQEFVYAWGTDSDIADGDAANFIYSKTEHVNNGDELYDGVNSEIISSPSSSNVGTGVIYRLIDEWNNDCPYDFKNIQFVRPLTGGEYDPKGENTWVYTFSFNNNGVPSDGSTDDVDNISYFNNKITGAIEIHSNVFFNSAVDSFISLNCEELSIIANGYSVKCYFCNSTDIEVTDEEGGAIYIGNKKVLTEE